MDYHQRRPKQAILSRDHLVTDAITEGNTMTANADLTILTARSMFLSAAVGDALGWPQEVRGGLVGGQKERDRLTARPEFRRWTRHAGHYSSRYRDPVRRGEYSDDTQLLLATARSCLAGDRWWERLTQVELPAWPTYQRGGGGTVLVAAGAWADGRPPWQRDGPARVQAIEKRYRGAGANGVAMRIAPHVLWADSPEDLIRRIVLDGIATHGHPRALVGALVYGFALRHAMNSRTTHGFGDSIEAAAAGLIDVDHVLPILPSDWGTTQNLELFAVTWQDTNKEVSQLLALTSDSLNRGAMSDPEGILERLGCTDPKFNGAGTVSAAASIYLASRFAARPLSGLLSAAFLRKADTDTLASLAAAILGALQDTRWLGTLADDVQDAAYITGLAERSAVRAQSPPPWPTTRPATLRRTLRDALIRKRVDGGEFPDGRQFRIDTVGILPDTRMLRAQLRLDDGQTVLIDIPADSVAEPSRPRENRDAKSPTLFNPGLDQGHRSHEPAVLSDERAPTSPPESTRLAAKARELGADVLLATRSLSRCAAFYAQLTGRNVPVRANAAEISPGLILYQTSAETLTDPSSIVVQIAVDNLAAAAKRLGIESIGATDQMTILEVRDPDGREVRIKQHSSSSSANR
ncbi:ADP-ribosylglycohydrolase family protein [Cryptosporangium sp. NPDC048952]|uniref:ADP-ribosylglycohydrolase family protein n=1 Tax=Cryptosporangium sp. NPDC048952 TaxID=3363961 RepID=UPI003715A8BB